MKQRLLKVWDFICRNRAYFLAFILPVAILFVSYIIFGVWPFGERSVLSLDLNAQYVYYFDYMYDVFAGKESLFYCWSRNLSGEFMGIIGYYLASPFNWLVWIYPRTMITEGLMTMMLAKAGASGLTMAFLLKKHRGYSNMTALLFSVMYALCGFFVVQTMNPMWLDGLVALPLVVMGVERVCDKRKFALYVVSLVYIFASNFYIGYMIGIFSALYFLYYIFSGKSVNRRFGQKCAAAVVYAAASVSAILMSCFMILPVYKSLSNGKFAFSTPDYSPAENFNIADIFIKLFPTTYDTVRMEGLPILYCGTLALIFAVVYFCVKKFPARERIAGGMLIGVLVLSMYIRPLDMMWHGGQLPNWLPYRYSFIISFLLVLFGAQAFDNIRSVRGKVLGGASVGLAGVLLYCDLNAGHEYFDTTLIIVIPLLVLAVTAPMAYACKKRGNKLAMRIAMVSLVSLEALLNTSVSLYDMDDDIVFSDRSTYRGDIPFTRGITEQIHEMDDGFYRMEKTYHRCVNDDIALRMYGMSHSSSTLNAKAISLLGSLGFSSREHYTRYDGATMLTDDIFGVKYVLSRYKCYVPYEDTVDIENEIGVTVYENKDALPIAYLADTKVIGYNCDETSPFLVQNRLANVLSGDLPLTIFRPINELEFDSDNIKTGTTTDAHYSYRKKNEDEPAWISYDVTMPADGEVYMYLPTDYERETQLYVDGQYRSNYFKYENYSIEYIGNYSEGETFNVRLDLQENAVYYKSAQFYYITPSSLEKFSEEMHGMNADTAVTRDSGTHLTINVNAAEDRALFTTIPCEEGWTAYIDGGETEIKSCLDESLICLEVPEGEHTIVLSFFPAGLKAGLILSAGGLMMFIIMLLGGMEAKKIKESQAKSEADDRL